MKSDKERFEEVVNQAYDIIWKLYNPCGKGCDLNNEYEAKLYGIINYIDAVMGR